MLSTFYAPLRKHYRIQSSSLLALNNPESIYPACPNSSSTAPAWLWSLPKTSLLPCTTDGWTQARPSREGLQQSLTQGTAGLVQLPASGATGPLRGTQYYCCTAKSLCEGPPQPLPHVNQRFMSTFSLQLLVQCVRVTRIHRWAQRLENIHLAENTEGVGEKMLKGSFL